MIYVSIIIHVLTQYQYFIFKYQGRQQPHMHEIPVMSRYDTAQEKLVKDDQIDQNTY